MGVQPQLLGGTERADGLEAGRTILAAGRTFGLAADRPVPATLILGMGNPILSDDAVGLRLAAELRGRLRDRPDLVRVEDCMVGGLSLLDLLAGFDRLIVLDSIKTAGGTAGMWYRFSGSCLQETMNLRTSTTRTSPPRSSWDGAWACICRTATTSTCSP